MGKALVLAEKPSVAREIARVLKCHEKGNGFYSGSGYIVTWALGHLVTLADPEIYDQKYKTWKAEDLPMLPARMELVVIKDTARQFKVVNQLMKQPDITELIIATDAGREGELVARWIMAKAGWRKNVKRLWISSQTDKAILEGFKNLRPGSAYENLYASAQCRAEADWLIGLNVTRALTCKYAAQLSAGRVQTPTLYMVVEREKEIQNFTPRQYWTVDIITAGFTMRWRDKTTKQARLFDKNQAQELAALFRGQRAEITEIKKQPKMELPPLAYDLTELQRDANRRYGLSAKTTSDIMQQLYERHKLVTYPRTDSRYISEDIVPTIPERLRSIAVGSYASWCRSLLKEKLNPGKRLVDNSKVNDHHAIIPTEEPLVLSRLSADELKVYDLIVKRFLAVLSPPFQYEETVVKASVKGETAEAKGKTVIKKGWRQIYEIQGREEVSGEEEEEEEAFQSFPHLSKGEQLEILDVKINNGQTKPPSRYTEATLLSAMEHPGKMLESRKLQEVLENSNGLGTPATRADIIEKLFSSFYLERKGKEIIPTSKGMQLIELVPGELKSPQLTALWEQQLTAISRGEAQSREFLEKIRQHTVKLVKTVQSSSQNYKHDNITRERCPECGKFLLRVKGKHGEMLVCQERSCGYRKGVSVSSNARCPECHKKMELRGEGENKIFICVCGYREKLSNYSKRKEGQKSSLGKREVSQYLRQQEKDESINTALADALAKLKGKL